MKKMLFCLIVITYSNILNSALPVQISNVKRSPREQNKIDNQFVENAIKIDQYQKNKPIIRIDDIEELAEKGVTQEALNKTWFYAVANGKVNLVKLLLKYHANPNFVDKEGSYFGIPKGSTPLIFAMKDLLNTQGSVFKKNYLEIVKELILHGGSLNITNEAGETAQSLFAKLDPVVQKEIEDAVNEFLAKHSKEIQTATGLPKELAELTAQQLFADLKSEKPENQE